jgi:hypothetical protein
MSLRRGRRRTYGRCAPWRPANWTRGTRLISAWDRNGDGDGDGDGLGSHEAMHGAAYRAHTTHSGIDLVRAHTHQPQRDRPGSCTHTHTTHGGIDLVRAHTHTHHPRRDRPGSRKPTRPARPCAPGSACPGPPAGQAPTRQRTGASFCTVRKGARLWSILILTDGGVSGKQSGTHRLWSCDVYGWGSRFRQRVKYPMWLSFWKSTTASVSARASEGICLVARHCSDPWPQMPM